MRQGYPAVSIESIVSVEKGQNMGKRMIEFATRILFGDGNPPRGYLFAQVC